MVIIQSTLSFLLLAESHLAGYSYGATLIWGNVLNATSSVVLSSPPYNFAPSMVGLTFIASLFGIILW